MIRFLEQKDKEKWAKLYNGYANFYKVPMSTEILDTLWICLGLNKVQFFKVIL